MEFSFGDEYKDGPLALGLHKKNSTYDIVQMDDCYIVNDDLNKIVKYTVQFCKEAGLPYYKKMQHEGLLRHLYQTFGDKWRSAGESGDNHPESGGSRP